MLLDTFAALSAKRSQRVCISLRRACTPAPGSGMQRSLAVAVVRRRMACLPLAVRSSPAQLFYLELAALIPYILVTSDSYGPRLLTVQVMCSSCVHIADSYPELYSAAYRFQELCTSQHIVACKHPVNFHFIDSKFDIRCASITDMGRFQFVTSYTGVEVDVVFFIWRNSPPPPLGQGLLIHEVSRSHTTTHHSR